MQGFATASGKQVSVREESLQRARALLSQSQDWDAARDRETLNAQHPCDSQGGFTSASGKVIRVSDEALKRAQKLFEEGSDSSAKEDTYSQMLSLATEGTQKTQQSEKLTFAASFASGSGKPIQVSEVSLNRARKLFEESQPVPEVNSGDAEPSSSFTVGFTTGSLNKPVHISEEGLRRAKKLFEDDSVVEIDSKPVQSFSAGFSSARGQPIAPSAESILKAKRLLGDDDTPEIEKITAPVGLSTGKSVTFSEEPLVRAKRLFEDGNAKPPTKTPATEKTGCRIKFCDPAKTKGRDTLKRRRDKVEPTTSVLIAFTTPKPASKPLLEATTKRVLSVQQSEKKVIAVKPSMREYLSLAVLDAGRKVGLFAQVHPLHASDDPFLHAIEETLLKEACKLIPGKTVDETWLKEQFKFTLWKFVSYSQRFPGFDCFVGEEKLRAVIQRRYQKEIQQGFRSTVTRLVDRDALPGSRMVLLVGEISHEGGRFQLELGDGWHSLYSYVEESDEVGKLVLLRKLRTGMKIDVCNCGLDGSSLKLHFNSLRLAKWDDPLGLSKYQLPFRVCISSIRPESGTVPSIEVCILKRYPPRYYVPSHRKTYCQAAMEEVLQDSETRFCMSALLHVKDAAPIERLKECYVTVDRICMDQLDAFREGTFVRFFALEISKYRPLHNGVMHLSTRMFRLSPRKPIAVPQEPVVYFSEDTELDVECAILGCVLHLDATPSGEILRLHLLTKSDEVVELKVHSHPFFGAKLSKLKRLVETQSSVVLFSNCLRDLEPAKTRLAAVTTEESELFTYLQGESVREQAEEVRKLAERQPKPIILRYAVHYQKCGKGWCNCRLV